MRWELRFFLLLLKSSFQSFEEIHEVLLCRSGCECMNLPVQVPNVTGQAEDLVRLHTCLSGWFFLCSRNGEVLWMRTLVPQEITSVLREAERSKSARVLSRGEALHVTLGAASSARICWLTL